MGPRTDEHRQGHRRPAGTGYMVRRVSTARASASTGSTTPRARAWPLPRSSSSAAADPSTILEASAPAFAGIDKPVGVIAGPRRKRKTRRSVAALPIGLGSGDRGNGQENRVYGRISDESLVRRPVPAVRFLGSAPSPVPHQDTDERRGQVGDESAGGTDRTRSTLSIC